MRNKIVCLDCRAAFSHDFNNDLRNACPSPQCSKTAYILPHRFRPPKKQSFKKWEVVEYFITNGFFYQPIIDEKYCYQPYPETLKEAQEFVKKYKKQALILKMTDRATKQ